MLDADGNEVVNESIRVSEHRVAVTAPVYLIKDLDHLVLLHLPHTIHIEGKNRRNHTAGNLQPNLAAQSAQPQKHQNQNPDNIYSRSNHMVKYKIRIFPLSLIHNLLYEILCQKRRAERYRISINNAFLQQPLCGCPAVFQQNLLQILFQFRQLPYTLKIRRRQGR